MKRLLLLVLLALIAALACADTYIIGTGTSASGLYPIYGYYDYSWSKQIYTAAEINAAGLNEAADITGIGLYVGNTPANFVMADQRIYMRHSTLTLYDTATDETGTGYPDNTGFQQVFQGTLTFNGGGWIYISFDNEFAWDNSSNLEVLWENWCLAGVTGYPTFRYTAMGTGNYLNVYKYQDGSFPAVAGTRSTSRPNITIVTPSVDPPNPAILIYPADNGWAFLDAILSWGDGGGLPTGYDVYFGDSETPPLVSDNQTGTTYTPTLAADTQYWWQVVPYNANGPAENCPVWSFWTPTATQLAEDFEVTTPFLPPGWANPGSWSGTTTTPFHGARVAYKSATQTPALLSTPILAVDANSALDFYYRTASTTGIGRMQVKQSTDRVTWVNVGDEIAMPVTTTWNHASVPLGSLTPGNYYLGFEVWSTTSTSTSIYLDHVFGPEPAAVAPGPVAQSLPEDLAENVSEYPTFTWTAPTIGGVPTGYKVYCDGSTDPTTEIADVNALTFTATVALNYSTPYYWKVVAYNASGSSVGNTVRMFTTRADPTIYVLPWQEDFGTTGTTFPPTNWTRWSGALADPSTLTSGSTVWGQDNWLNDTTVTPVNYCARMNIYSTGRQHWLITPPIQMPGAGYQLEFDIGLTDYANSNPISSDPNGTTGVDDKFIVLIGDGVTWSPANILRQYDNVDSPYVYNDISHLGNHLTFPLDSYTGIKYIAFYGESTVSNADNDFFVDNVLIRQTPAGAPEHVTLAAPEDGSTGVFPESVTLNWTASLTGGTPAYYEVYVGEFPIDPGTSYYGEYFYETENTSLDLSAQTDIDLAYGSTWYWAVLPYNSNGDSPNPDVPEFMIWDFTIVEDPAIVALPHEQYFDEVTAPVLPYGWIGYVDATVTTAYVNTYSSTTYAVSAPNVVRLYNSTDANANVMLLTPEIELPINTIKAKFYARGSTAGQVLLVGTGNPTDGSFNQVGSIATTAAQVQYQVSFANWTGTDTRIAFKHGLGATSRTIYIDNVQLIEMFANDLAATALTGSNYQQAGVAADFVVTVYNEGTSEQSAYDVYLKSGTTILASLSVTTPLAAGSSAQHTLTWTPSTGGVIQIFGEVTLTGDEFADNNVTPSKEVYVLDASMEVIPVGDDATTTSSTMLPVDMYYRNSVTEELYFNDEMHLQSGTITALVYKNTFLNERPDKAVKIWMAHTTVTDLTAGWLPAVDYTLVFDGTVDFPSGVNYVVIPLQFPFAYTGGTLATRVYRVFDTGALSSSDKFFYTTNAAHSTRSRYLRSDSVTYDPLAPSANGTTLNYHPNTMFVVQNAVLETGAGMQGYVLEAETRTPIAGASVTLTDERYVATTDAEGFYEFNFWEPHTVSATASKHAYYDQTVTGIALTMGNTVNQNFVLGAMPRGAVNGLVTSNDYPAGLEGAEINLLGIENYQINSAANGTFSILNVLGSSTGITYTVTVEKEGYESYTGTATAYGALVTDLGTINLTEDIWDPVDVVASHVASRQDAVSLVWGPAAPPAYYFADFEQDNGGWVGSGHGDWEYTDAYTLTGYTDTDSYADTPPTSAHSGDGLWGTKVLSSYSNSTAWSYLRQTFDLSGYDSPVLSIWHYMNGYNTWDYGLIKANGNTVWGSSAAAVFMPWQQLTVDLSAYEGSSSVEISFEWYATGTVNYAGWYVDDIYIGSASRNLAGHQLGSRPSDGRWLLGYDVYRLLEADAGTPANWTLLQSDVADTTFLDTGFDALAAGAYKWAVKASYSGDLESEAALSNTLGRVFPPEVEDPIVQIVGTDVSFGWPAQPGASYYIIYGSNDPYAAWPWTVLAYSATPSFTFASATIPYKFFKIAAADGEMPAGPPATNK